MIPHRPLTFLVIAWSRRLAVMLFRTEIVTTILHLCIFFFLRVLQSSLSLSLSLSLHRCVLCCFAEPDQPDLNRILATSPTTTNANETSLNKEFNDSSLKEREKHDRLLLSKMARTRSVVFIGSIVAVVVFFVAVDVAAAAKLLAWRPEMLSALW